MTTYKVVRMYLRDATASHTIKKGLTEAEAQKHCQDPETSSSTCTSAAGRKRTERKGPWFDGYAAE